MTKQADGQEEENKTIEHDLGRRNYDPSQIGFKHLLQEIREIRKQVTMENNHIRNDVSDMKEVLNNGVKKQTTENTKELKKVCTRIDEINTHLSSKKGHEIGVKKTIWLAVKVVSLVGSGILGTLAILQFLGEI